ncbi:MAG: 3-hydroxyacyl-CoA dehydrogenase NAD-binding domain-containing protein [Syntrophorhabdus sp.]|jgi:3-hydroxybutyryl-CoA dehydrogenase|nr:3-hydroxybutyryl-CoA dehydrogenase [Syntrophorhabdus sp.]MBP8743630.1 3-hydroxybutyryl-CoA dehydrogenase [Syntrophorhabdus sp.]MDI9557687.1 3-hydroxyacyl-CoA dehydrogenase NAD-binding domain-containing protein [Pseudomonadota bacterium]OPX95705.1 MAG: putative 3-hydroxybutyryl-CoA dehydrogenase [Syntrophorhabdus sp. PtaB.Bin027]OQB75826.1 MAG: putative 3-hydroxybutyryl-CoA dehydrogenase [Deltaproteobacteria bacterium ADurb.Bin135]
MDIKTIGVLGAGSMGNGIAQVAAQSGYNVVMRDIDDKFVDRALKGIDKFLSKSVEKGKITSDDKSATLGRIKGTTKMEDLKDVDFVVEVVLEDMDLKKKVFKELDELTRKEVILATNTSSMSITEIATATNRQDKVVGMHFFNPVPLMRLVEVIRGYNTSDDTIAVAMDLARKFKKEPIEVKKDIPCFVVNRLMMPHFLEAILLLQEGIASAEDIDKAAKLGLNYPMGPFELMDLTGIDIAYHVAEYLHKEMNKELKWVSPRLMKDMVKANRLGMKTGSGWYDYPKK